MRGCRDDIPRAIRGTWSVGSNKSTTEKRSVAINEITYLSTVLFLKRRVLTNEVTSAHHLKYGEVNHPRLLWKATFVDDTKIHENLERIEWEMKSKIDMPEKRLWSFQIWKLEQFWR